MLIDLLILLGIVLALLLGFVFIMISVFMLWENGIRTDIRLIKINNNENPSYTSVISHYYKSNMGYDIQIKKREKRRS